MYLRTLVEIFSDTSDMGTLRIFAIGVFLIGIVYLVLNSLLGGIGSAAKKSASVMSGRKSKRKKKRNQGQPESANVNTDTDINDTEFDDETSASDDGAEVSS